MRLKLFVAVVIASTFIAGFMNPASAAPAPRAADGGTSISCANPPDTPDATPENRDRYVSLWSARMADKAWLKHFTELDEVPADVEAEGFHAMDGKTQLWLNSCLLDDMLATAHETPTAAQREKYLMGLNMVIFGKEGIAKLRAELAEKSPAQPSPEPVQQELTGGALEGMADDLASDPSLTSAKQPTADETAPKPSTATDLTSQTSPGLTKLLKAPAIDPVESQPQAVATPATTPTGLEPAPITQLPLVPEVLQAVNDVLQLVSKIQGQLFTLPGLNLLATVFYKVCAESETLPLSCSVSLPVGVPIPADVTGDNFPDVIASLFPMVNLQGDIGARFQVQRLNTDSGPLPAHIFAVYDTPVVKKRIEFGYDGRTSTLANHSITTFALKNPLDAIAGDIQVQADVSSTKPGSTEALTFAVKSLVGGSIGVPPSEEDPMGGAVQMAPFPEKFTVGAHLVHTSSHDQDTFTVQSSTPSRVDAIIDQRTTTTATKSNRRFTATVDKLPTSVTVDLLHQGEDKQSIDYKASAPIGLVEASSTAIPDITKPDQTKSTFQLKGVPTHVHLDLKKAEDILYTADGNMDEIGFSTETVDADGPVVRMSGKAKKIPTWVHVTDKIDDDTAVTYDANDNVESVELGMYSRGEKPADETDIVAKATSIPKHVEFTLTKAGVLDVAANEGVGLIEAQASRGGGDLYGPTPAGDHLTVLKRGDQLGADLQLTGFKSAHFDGTKDTSVALGLSPGGQSFEAIADLKDPDGLDALAKARISALPQDIAVTLSPTDGTATYTASSVIPELEASFTKRDTDTFASVKLTDLPKQIGLTFNTSGAVPSITYDADSRLGSIDATYQEKTGGMALHGLISDLPKYMKIGGIDPMVFDARESETDPAGSSYLGQVFFQYATDGVFASPPTTDDHVYVDTDTVDAMHAELQYTGLKYLSLDTSNQELHAQIKNTTSRILRAYLTTPTLSLTGFIDKVPAEITLGQVGNLVSYDASSGIDEIATNLQRANGDQVAVQIKDVPKEVDLTFDGTGSQLIWHASAATGQLSALAHLTPQTLGGTRNFDAGLTITSIPADWNASWANGDVLFQAPAPGIGSIEASVTNHGVYHLFANDHLTAYYDDDSGNLDASLKVSNLRKAAFTKLTNGNGGGFQADLNMGNQGAFDFSAEVLKSGSKLKANGGFTKLPSAITLTSNGGRITYSGNTNPDLTLSVAAGTPAALAATPAPNNVHGVSVRDGVSGTEKAVKANLYLTGLPSGLDLNSPAGTYTVSNYHPSIATLVVDVVLKALAPKPLSLQVQQVVPTASPVTFTFGPFLTSTAPNGTHNLSINYTASQPLGALTAEATYDNTDDAKLMISQIPANISVNAGFGADQKTVGVAMSQGISDITAAYKKVGAANFAASVHLHDVPSSVNLQIGRGTSSGGGTQVTAPDFTMTASQPGLDIGATASAEIADPADIKAAVNLQITDLGHTVTGALDGTSLHVTSAPATGSFLLQAAGTASKDVDLGFSGAGFTNTGTLTANVDLKQLTLGFENASDLRLDLGVTTGLRGDFNTFTFGQQSDIQVHIVDDLDFFIDWPDPFGSTTIDLFYINANVDLGNVVPHWRINSNTFGTIFSIPVFSYVIGTCSVNFKARPGPGFTTATSTFTLPAPIDDGEHTPAWLMTPDLNLLGVSLPDFGLDLIAFFASPYGHGFKVDAGCETF